MNQSFHKRFLLLCSVFLLLANGCTSSRRSDATALPVTRAPSAQSFPTPITPEPARSPTPTSTATANPPTLTPTSTITPTLPEPSAGNTTLEEGLFFLSIEGAMYGYVLPEGKDSALNRLGMDFVVFSHHADRLVRYSWDTPQMWISDLTLENEFEISDDTFGSCPTYGYWSSDDLHLICDAEDRSQAGLIYHLRENSWESWPFACDRLAMSPKTGRLATWCLEVGRSNSYSVIEWGGEIWKTDQPPTTIMAHDPSGRRSMDELWSWSADGEKVAYYDSKGSLIIANAEGVALHAFTGSGIESFDYMLWQDSSIEWSADGTRLLVFAKGSADQPCPVGAAQDSGEAFCWQVLDAQSGEVVWHASELSNQFSERRERHYDGASISSDGHYLALTSIQDNERDLFGFDIQSKEENQFFLWNIYADYMRWGSVQSSP